MSKERARLHILRYFVREAKDHKVKGIELTEEAIREARDRIRKSCGHLELGEHTPCDHSIYLLPDGTIDVTNKITSRGQPHFVLTSTFREGVENLARQNELPYDTEQVKAELD